MHGRSAFIRCTKRLSVKCLCCFLVSSVAPKKAKTEYIIPMPKKSGLGFNRGTKSVDSGDQSQEDKEAAEAIMKGEERLYSLTAPVLESVFHWSHY